MNKQDLKQLIREEISNVLSSNPIVYKGVGSGNYPEGLYKVENFPAVPGQGQSDTSNDEGGEGWNNLILKNNLLPLLHQIYSDPYEVAFGGGDYRRPQTMYVYLSGDNTLSITPTLSYFAEGYNTEEGWSVREWVKV